MIVNTRPSTQQWNDAVNAVNIYTDTQYKKIQDVLTKVDSRVEEVKTASKKLEDLIDNLRKSTAFLTYLVESF